MKYKAYFYLKQSGKAPLAKYIRSIKSIQVKAVIINIIDRLIKFKCDLPHPFIKPVTDKIYELRLEHKNSSQRIFYFIYSKGKIILLDGYTKKSNKIPKRILKRVKKYYLDYLKHHYERRYKIH